MKLDFNTLKLFLLPLVTALIFSSCTTDRAPSTLAQRYALKGRILSVDKNQKRVSVEHEAIVKPDGDLYMEPMTMKFALRDVNLYDELREGDEIQATLVVDTGRSYLDEVSFTRPIGDAQTRERAERIAAQFEPPPGAALPNFSLVNQNNEPITARNYAGKNLLVTFIYTRCPLPDYCPLMSENFAQVKRAVDAQDDLKNSVALLSVTIDPKFDTPAVLRDYAARYVKNSNGTSWDFATGAPEQIAVVARFFGLSYTPARDDSSIDHSLMTALISPDGKLVKLYRGNDWQPVAVVSDLERQPSATRGGETE